jgi:antitoxin component YwqK of YwqJK toxin-antitoxin module
MQLKMQKTIFLHIGRTYEQESALVLQKPLLNIEIFEKKVVYSCNLKWIKGALMQVTSDSSCLNWNNPLPKKEVKRTRLINLFQDHLVQTNEEPPKKKPKLKRISSSIKMEITYPNGSIYVGKIKDGYPHGFGTWTPLKKCKYVGFWDEGVRSGNGTTFRKNGCKNYEGSWAFDQPSGLGTAYRNDGTRIYVGFFKEGKRHGIGDQYSPSDQVICSGEWENNVLTEDFRIKENTTNNIAC